MPNINRSKSEDHQDELIRALGDRSRRRILKALYLGPLPVHELALHLDDPTRIGYHLRVLRSAGIVHSSKDRYRHVVYEYDRASLVELRRILEEIPIDTEGYGPS